MRMPGAWLTPSSGPRRWLHRVSASIRRMCRAMPLSPRPKPGSRVRRGAVDTERLGVGHIRLTGAWFAGASVVRDAAAIAGIELLPWDAWGGADDLSNHRDRLAVYAGDLDSIAARLAGDGATFENALAVLVDHEWIGVPQVVTSYHGIGMPAFDEVRLPGA